MIPFQTDPITEALTAAQSSASTESPKPISVEDGLQQLKELSLNDFLSEFTDKLVHFAFDLAIAILVFYIGKFIINRLYKVVTGICVRRDVDRSLTTFILSFVKIVLYFILIVIVIGILGIETSSFLALFASAGVAIGMALSGTLQNFAGGVLILLLKPYKIGDYIEAQGYTGYVSEIQIFHTIITTYDNKAILLPNGGLSTSSVNNWSRETYRRIAWEISISYGDDIKTAREAILAMFEEDPRIIRNKTDDTTADSEQKSDTPDTETMQEVHRPGFWRRIFGNRRKVREAIAKWEESHNAKIKAFKPCVAKDPSVCVSSLADSSVVIEARAWVLTENYWSVYYDYNERFYTELPQHGINFPFPQMDVHLKNQA